MKLRVLGKMGRYPLKDAGTSSFLVNVDNENIILDMGCSSLSNLQKHIQVQDLTAVILSHLHGDHIADFKTFTYMVDILRAEGRLNRDIIVYLPKTPDYIYKDLINTKGLTFKVISDNLCDRIGNSVIKFYSMKHPIETYGVRIEYKNKVISYTADTLICDNLRPLLENSDIAIGDACILSKDFNNKSVHISVKDLASLSGKYSVKTLMLAHLPENQDEILNEANKYTNSMLAEEDKEYVI